MKILSVYKEVDRNVLYAYITISNNNFCLLHFGEMDKYIFNKLLFKLANDNFCEYFNKNNAVITAKTVKVMIYKLDNYVKSSEDNEVHKLLEELLQQIEKYKINCDFSSLFIRIAREQGYKSTDDMFNKISAKELSKLIVLYKSN